LYSRPGRGEAREDCGRVDGWIYSECEHKIRHPIMRSCDRWECPVCYERAASRAARRIEAQWFGKIEAYTREWGHVDERPQHYTWSLSSQQYEYVVGWQDSDAWVAWYKNEAVKAMKRYSVGVFGGVVVVHPWRKKHADGSACEHRECDERHVWVWGPHVHFVGWGRFIPSHQVNGGWIYKHIQDRGSRDIWATCFYQLTHGAIIPGKQAYSWVGLMSSHAMSLVKKVSFWSFDVCPDCGEPIYRDAVDPESGAVVQQNSMRKVEKYYYKVRKKRLKTPHKRRKRWF
jgi:hypothetical protein